MLAHKDFAFIRLLQKKFPETEVFLVGGIIRDALLKRNSKDYDFVVRNVSMTALRKFFNTIGWVDLVGKTFGVLKFLPKNSGLKEPIDIALPRTEHAFNTGGYRDVEVQSDPKLAIEEDLKRRDFTINALAYNVQTKKLIDLFGGMQDIKKKKLKTVGTPSERFKEDYSRILRALRFSCQLGFTIEQTTWRAIKQYMKKINKKTDGEYVVPRETISQEMTKSFIADPAHAFSLYDRSGAIAKLMPELLKMKKCPQPKNFHAEGDVWKHTLLCLKNLSSKKFTTKFGAGALSAELVFGTLLHDLGKPYTIERKDRLRFNNHDSVSGKMATAIAKRLRLSSASVNVEHVDWLVRRHMLVTHSKKSPMKRTTMEKYFFNPHQPGDDLMKLMFADVMATVPPSGKPDFSDYKELEKQIAALKKISKKKKGLPEEIIDGNEIMKLLKLKPGPQIGLLKQFIREEQLKGTIKTKRDALNIIKKHG